MVNTPSLWCREVLNLVSGLGGARRAVVTTLADVHRRLIVACDAAGVGDVVFSTFSHASSPLYVVVRIFLDRSIFELCVLWLPGVKLLSCWSFGFVVHY